MGVGGAGGGVWAGRIGVGRSESGVPARREGIFGRKVAFGRAGRPFSVPTAPLLPVETELSGQKGSLPKTETEAAGRTRSIRRRESWLTEPTAAGHRVSIGETARNGVGTQRVVIPGEFIGERAISYVMGLVCASSDLPSLISTGLQPGDGESQRTSRFNGFLSQACCVNQSQTVETVCPTASAHTRLKPGANESDSSPLPTGISPCARPPTAQISAPLYELSHRRPCQSPVSVPHPGH